MLPGFSGRDAPSRSPLKESLLNEVGLDYVFERILVLADCGGEVFNSYWSAAELYKNCSEEPSVDLI